MTHETNGNSKARSGWLTAILLLGCVSLFVILRLCWVGHLLVWDEAMDVCTVRSFLAGVRDDFAGWFWRHPPLFCLLMMGTQPGQPGFPERVALLSIGIGVLNQLALFALCRKVFNRRVALWAALFFAVVPGGVFFDVWIKRDHPVVGLGLIAIWLLFSGRSLYAGLCLGVALLCKESAVFYALAANLLWMMKAGGQRRFRDFGALNLTALAVCGWWYLIVLPVVNVSGSGTAGLGIAVAIKNALFRGAGEHVRVALGSDVNWNQSWTFYLAQWPVLIGPVGLLLAGAGLGLLARQVQLARQEGESQAGNARQRLWPVALLVPNYLLLSLLSAKVPWVPMVLFPGWVALQAVAVERFGAFLDSQKPGRHWAACGGFAVGIMCAIAMGSTVVGRDYEDLLRQVDEGQWRGARYSREAAELMNRVTRDGERALVTAFHYWQGIAPGHACPVFACYFKRDVAVLIRPFQRPFSELVRDMRISAKVTTDFGVI
jgi:hypothetical protein